MDTFEIDKALVDSTVVHNWNLFQDTGIISHIEKLDKIIKNYEEIFSSALNVFNSASVTEIMDTTVKQLFAHFLPNFIYFLLMPLKKSDAIHVRGFKNYKPVEYDEFNISVENLRPVEDFFLKNPKPIVYETFEQQSEISPILHLFEKVHPKILIPIVGPSNLYALTVIGPKLLSDAYTSSELTFIRYFMIFVSQAIQNYLHYENSLRDVKTGLFNHGFFMTRLIEETERIKRSNESSSIMMIDIDYFKNFNDSFGHLAGDYVLENIARVIKENVRKQDVASRFGGEEFTILLPSADRNMVWTAAERLRTSIANLNLSWGEKSLPRVTVSLGVYTLNGWNHITANDVIAYVDKALYQAKKNGRNCTSCLGTGFLFKMCEKVEKRDPRLLRRNGTSEQQSSLPI
jgi:diguanylate cyclase (GGDEF)-like protein